MNMQRKVYFWKPQTDEVMMLPVQPLKFYQVAFSAGWVRCSLKEYRKGLIRRKVLTGTRRLAV